MTDIEASRRLLDIPVGVYYTGRELGPDFVEVVRGEALKDGDVVLCESLREFVPEGVLEDPELHPVARARILESERFCKITDFRWTPHHEQISFIGLYADGTQRSRRYSDSHFWYRKL